MYYDDMNGNAYAGAMGMDMMVANNDNMKNQQQQHYVDDEVDYSTSRARVMSEIIV